MEQKWKRPLALLLSVAMMFSMSGTPVYAADMETGASAVCPHHVHDETCGYSEGTTCTHEHTDDCYTLVTQCVHEHTAECYSDGMLPAEGEEKAADACTHVCSEESGCITKELNCPHVHDETCGYSEGSPCTFDPSDCELCSPTDSGEPEAPAECACETLCTADSVNPDCPVCGAEGADLTACAGTVEEGDAAEETDPAQNPAEQTILSWEWIGADNLNEGVLALPDVSAENPVDLDAVVSMLPTGITATVDGSEEPVELTITWACEDFVSPATGGTYTFAAALPQSYTLSEETAALTVPVILGGDLLPVDTLATASWYGLSVAGTSISGGGYWLNDSSTGGITNNGASASNYNVHFDANTNTLTLNNANLTKASMQGAILFVYAANTTDVTINLIGDNVLESSNIYGIYTKKTNMTITGSGSLTVSGSQYGIAEFDEQPSNSTFTFTIAGGTVTATGGIAGTRLSSIGSIQNTLLLTGGSLTAEGGKYGIHMRGRHPWDEKTITVSSGGSLVASGDTYGIYFDAETSGNPAWRINVNSGGSLVTNSTSVTPTGSGGWLLYGGNTPTVNGTVALPMDLTISKGTALSIAKGSNFIIPDGVVLTNYGTIGNQGTISGNGQIINYGGINSFNGGTNNVANTVNRSVMTVTSKPNTRNIPYGISVTFTAALSRTDAGGTVRFKLDGEIVTEAVVSNGEASITLKGLEKGSHTVTAEYTGDGTYASETGSYQFQIVDGYTITMKTNGVGSIKPNNNTIQPVAENKYAYAAGERVDLRTTAPMGYEISYVTVETEDGRVITPNIVLSQVFFTMPAENVTVYASFAAEADVFAVNRAHFNIEFYVMKDLKISQEGLATQDEEAIEAWLEARMNSTVTDDTVTCTAEVTSFTPAVAGTPNNPAGTNGSFSVDWSVRKGDAMKSSTSEGTITPTVFQAEISGIEIKTQPTKMDYSFGETLDLSGLVITVHYEGTDDTKEVAWSADSGITADPANGTALYASQHNGKPVTITYEGKTATTSALTVGKADQTGFAFTGEPYRAVACGDEPFAVEATGGQGNGTVTYAVTEGQDVVSVSVSTVTILKSGTATITATKAADEDYNEATATLVVYVTPKQVDGVYQIGTANDLFWFAGLVNGTLENVEQDTAASAVLTADIDLSGETWTPIGNYDQSSRPNNKYAGTFDGAGHTIEGLKIESSADWQGFVGYLGEGGVIENLTLGETCSVTGGDYYVGGICGYTNGGIIESCTNAGTVTGSNNVGGVCGLSRGTVTGCTNEGTVTGSGRWVGGVCGLSRGTVTGCTNEGTVIGSNNVGGVCGTNTGGTTENCANFGAVNGSGEWVGGVCGGNTGTITGCTNSGAVTGNGENVGGIVGYTEDGAIENCQNSGSVTGGKYTGAICGWNNAGTITGCTNEGAVNGSGDLGGICGHNEGTVKNCTNSGAVNNGDKNTVGGICGYSKTDVTGCTNSGAVTGKTYVGGIVGYTDDGAVETCQNSGSITGNGEDVGGICGFSNQPITNCANTGDITGGSVVGGVCGLMVSSKVTISNCYNTGTVTGSAVGAVYGKNGRGQSGDGQGTITNCYYQSEETTSTQEGATPKTADQFSSGEVCWLLNGSTSEGTLAWYQNLDNDQDKDTYPVLDSSHGVVYPIYDCTGLTISGYNNTATSTESHNYEDGFCTLCGGYQPANLNGDVYEIANAGQLFWFAALVNGDKTHAEFDSQNSAANAKLLNDITLNENVLNADGELNGDGSGLRVWTPMGSDSNRYVGTFDGNGHTIYGLYIPSGGSVGLVGHLGRGGVLQGITLADGYVRAEGGAYAGGICARNWGTIADCHNGARLVGWGQNNIGGICGCNEDGGIIRDCTNSGRIQGVQKVGGIVGWNYLGHTVTGCSNTGNIIGESNCTGGICGDNNESTVFANCTNTGTVNGGQETGGICGTSNRTLTGCVNTGNVTGTYNMVGGICGHAGSVENCANRGTVTGTYEVGGICGYLDYNGTLQSCYSTGTVTATEQSGSYAERVGAIGGYIETGSVANCYWLDGSAGTGIGSCSDDGTSENVAAKTAAEFASGEVTWLLNGSTSEGTLAWYQNLDNDQDKDTYPVLDSSHGIVYCIEGDPASYSNDPNGNPAQIISVDITWGELSFTYSDGTWNPDTHTYDGAGWNVDEEGGNSIKVENTGNTDVNVTYDYKAVENGITGSFTDGENPVSAPVSLPENGSSTVYLILAGKPKKELEKATIGSVTVTIGGESE